MHELESQNRTHCSMASETVRGNSDVSIPRRSKKVMCNQAGSVRRDQLAVEHRLRANERTTVGQQVKRMKTSIPNHRHGSTTQETPSKQPTIENPHEFSPANMSTSFPHRAPEKSNMSQNSERQRETEPDSHNLKTSHNSTGQERWRTPPKTHRAASSPK